MKQAIFTKVKAAELTGAVSQVGLRVAWSVVLGGALLLGGCGKVTPTSTTQANESSNTTEQRGKAEDLSMDCIPGEGMAGGWHRQADVSAEAQTALDTVLAQMNSAAKLKSIREVRTQVVAGINFAIEFEMDNGEVWHTVVYRDLQGKYSMKQVAQQGSLKPFCPPK